MSELQGKNKLLEQYQKQIRTGMDQAADMLSNFLEAGSDFYILPLNDSESAQNDLQNESLAGICLKVEGAVDGSILLLFAEEDARRLAGLLMRQATPENLESDQMRSTLQEVGNIFASGVLSSLDDRLNLRAMPSPPSFLLGTSQQIQDSCRENSPHRETLMVESKLNCSAGHDLLFEGSVFFQISTSSLKQFNS
ncbi:MAG TPA: chemotaxis protein CheX [Geopsychrobacteraceae bacterium]|nr:chemotaxis protein CheX [Geopsychrobacteraceae bacterium]